MPQVINNDITIGDVLHEWTIQQYDRHDRSTFWYILMIGLGLLLVLYGVITGNFLFSLIIILFSIIIFLQSHQEAPQVPFRITDIGVVVGGKFYEYSEFEGFYLVYKPPHTKTLFLDTKSILQPAIRVPLLDNNPIEVKHSLREFLVEDTEKEEEPLADRAARNWKIH